MKKVPGSAANFANEPKPELLSPSFDCLVVPLVYWLKEGVNRFGGANIACEAESRFDALLELCRCDYCVGFMLM